MNKQQKSLTMSAALAAFFGLGGGGGERRRSRHTPTGNRTLPRNLQQEVIKAADAKRARKNDTRRIVYYEQTRLDLFR